MQTLIVIGPLGYLIRRKGRIGIELNAVLVSGLKTLNVVHVERDQLRA